MNLKNCDIVKSCEKCRWYYMLGLCQWKPPFAWPDTWPDAFRHLDRHTLRIVDPAVPYSHWMNPLDGSQCKTWEPREPEPKQPISG
jgi:hypothetical protein